MSTNNTHFFKILLDVQILRCAENFKENTSSTDVAEGATNILFSTFVNGTALWEMVKEWVKEEQQTTITESDGCERDYEVTTNFYVYPAFTLAFFTVVFLTLILPLILVWIFKLFDKESDIPLQKTCSQTENNECISEDKVYTENLKTSHKSPSGPTSTQTTDYISLMPRIGSKYGAATYVSCDLADFLKHTSDILILELDKFLVDKSGRASSPLQSVISSPRVSRRQMPRTTGRIAESEADDTDEDPTEQTAWREFQEKIVYKGAFNTTSVDYDDIFDKSLGHCKTLMGFYKNNCAMNFRKSSVANVIVNYSLLILEKAFLTAGPHKGLRFMNFVPTGSCSTGTRCCEPNQFDVLVLFQCTDFSVHRAMDRINLTEIPHGRVYLSAESSSPHPLLKIRESQTYVSSREFLTVASELMDVVLQKLTTKARSVIDRLPFRLQRAATPGLVLSIDTRSVFGFGLTEIRVHLNPALPLLTHSWDPSTLLYAVPLWTYQDLKRKPSNRYTSFLGNNSIPVSDLSWNISYASLESLYLQTLNWKFSLEGERGCHLVCLQILKALFTATSKKTLLSKGEVSPFVVQTVTLYILVESSTRQWSFECLPDRFSDSVHFLRRALKNKRLPNFFVSNPYFLKQFAHLQSAPILSRGRQENLLSEITPDMAEKMLSYMESRLQETGLSGCVKEKYSEDVWEYEYFLQV